MKIPRYMYKTPTSVAHPATVLEMAAKAVDIEASFHRQHKNKEAAWALKNLAYDLRRVASGYTFAQAFDWPAQVNAEREKS